MTRPAGRDFEYGDELPLIAGGISGVGLPFDLTDDEADAYLEEMRELEHKRRPCGFTASWPPELRRIA